MHDIEFLHAGCDHSFQDLLGKLARIHESVLKESSMLKADNDGLRHQLQLATSGQLREACFSKDAPREMLIQVQPASVNPNESTSEQCSDLQTEPLVDCYGETSLDVPSISSIEMVVDKQDFGVCPLSPTCSNGSDLSVQHEHFQARQDWEKASGPRRRRSLSKSNTVHVAHCFDEDEHEYTKILMQTGCLQQCISFPASRGRTCWDLIGAFLIFWDMAIIPLSNTFLASKDSDFLDAVDWVTLIFWTMNVPASLLVGYVKNGVTVMIPRKIFVHYLKTWFILDLVVVFPDWIFTIAKMVGSGSKAGGSVKLLRIVRLARIMRLLRLAKLKVIFQNLNDLINSEYTSIVVNILKMILSLLACNHFIGCAWFLMSEVSSGPNWVTVHDFDEVAWTYQYATSFHWAVTQFTPSSMHVQPQNLVERTFAITVVVFGLVGFSYLVGSITGSLTELRKMNSDMTKQFWNLRRFLKQNSVPTELTVRIQKYLEHQWQMRKESVSRDNVTVLKFLTEQLTSEMQCAIVLPNILIHPLFQQLNTDSPATMQRLANNVIDRKLLASGDSFFHAFEQATHMSFVVHGRFQYIRMNSPVKEWVDKGEDWIAEPILWTSSWYHHGELIATKSSDLLLINASLFPKVTNLSPQATFLVSNYAIRYIARLNEKDVDTLSDITQGECETDDLRNLLVELPLPRQSTRSLGSSSVALLKSSSTIKRFLHTA